MLEPPAVCSQTGKQQIKMFHRKVLVRTGAPGARSERALRVQHSELLLVSQLLRVSSPSSHECRGARARAQRV
jgi:hypothetical protein